MRPLFLSLGVCLGVLGVAWAQTTGGGASSQLPVGQTDKHFQIPIYQENQQKATITAEEATGITLNRAETTQLKIELYENDVITTTITSPKADLYITDQKMRTKNTVRIDRSDMLATSQICDFDLKTKIYLLRTNVRVILKNFDASLTPGTSGAHATPPGTPPPTSPILTTPAVKPISPNPARNDSLLDSPGAYSDTNSAPNPPPNPDPK